MSEKDKINQRITLNEALRVSFKKMLELKKKLGQSVVTVDGEGNPLIITAEEAEKFICDD